MFHVEVITIMSILSLLGLFDYELMILCHYGTMLATRSQVGEIYSFNDFSNFCANNIESKRHGATFVTSCRNYDYFCVTKIGQKKNH